MEQVAERGAGIVAFSHVARDASAPRIRGEVDMRWRGTVRGGECAERVTRGDTHGRGYVRQDEAFRNEREGAGNDRQVVVLVSARVPREGFRESPTRKEMSGNDGGGHRER